MNNYNNSDLSHSNRNYATTNRHLNKKLDPVLYHPEILPYVNIFDENDRIMFMT